MAKKHKSYRRFIRINGELTPSPRFRLQSDADDWYEKMLRKSQFGKFGLLPTVRAKDIPTLLTVAAEVMTEREKEYGKNTTVGEDQNLRLHILPALGHLRVHQISAKVLEKFLQQVTVTKTLKGGKTVQSPASTSTKGKLRALLSIIFEHLLEEENPVVPFNPVKRLNKKKSGKRVAKGPKLPTKLLENDEACIKFMEAAGRLGSGPITSKLPSTIAVRGRSFVYAAIMLMTGSRISELMALRWSHVDFKNKTITYAWVFERNSKSLKKRTKKGENEERVVPMPPELERILLWWQENSKHNGPDDFILSKPGGGHMTTSTIRQLHNRICKASGQSVSHHGLRHTFGRLFIKRTGNLSVLQALLGHSSITTTQIYAKLNAEHLQPFVKDMEIGGQKSSPMVLPQLTSKTSKGDKV